jgi:hypothetical protein
MVLEPEFLDKHPEVAKRVGRPAAALVSTDKIWITWVFTSPSLNILHSVEALLCTCSCARLPVTSKTVVYFNSIPWWNDFRFMKLRLDRVLKGELTVDSPEEALAGKLTTVKFERPEKWIAPYPKYEGDWWTPFLYKKD